MRIYSRASASDRNQLRLTAEGLIAENYPRALNAGGTALTSQTMIASLLGLRAGDVVASISVYLTAAGSSLTLAKVGLYSTAGVLLGSSANSTAPYTAGNTLVTTALSTPYTVTSAGGYYAALLVVGTTPPTVARGAGQAGLLNGLGSGVRAAAIQASQADLPATATFAATDRAYWFGVS